MEIQTKTIILISAVVSTGLSAGFFDAWQVSVIPGTKKVVDLTYLETMQSINRAILNPFFFLVFFGSMVLLGISSIYEFQTGRWVFYLALASFITYLAGTFGVTVLGNVPLNDQLDAMDLVEVSTQKMAEFRQYYEFAWNRLHLIRTAFAVLSFLLSLAALFMDIKR